MRDFIDDQQENSQDDSQVEITDLDVPGDTGNNTSLLTSRFLAWQRSLNRGQVRVAMTLGLVFLVALVLLLNVHVSSANPQHPHSDKTSQYMAQSFPVNIKPSMVMFPRGDGFGCVKDVAWSADGKYTALLGYQKNCVDDSHVYEHGLVAVHDALSGKLIRQLSPDDAIVRSFSRQFPATHDTLLIYYTSILWSPDGKNLALTFSLSFPLLSLPQGSGFFGVMLIPDRGGDAQVLLHFQKDHSLPVEWDLQRHQAINDPPIPSLQSFVPAGTAVSPTFAYRWGTNGALIPQIVQGHHMMMPHSRPGGSLSGRVGNPDGGSSFTIWQPGMSTLNTQNGGVSTNVPGIYTWHTFFVAWSPDGRYLVDSFFLEGQLQPLGQPVPSRQMVVNLHMQQLPIMKVRDMALQHLLLTLNASSSNVFVSWHPDGFVLATYDNLTDDLDLLDCKTGYEIASLLLPSPFTNRILGGTTIMRWSPDGSHLLLFDPQLGMAMIWQVNGLTG